jgi:hypothetical protein
VRDPARQHAEALELLGLLHLRFERATLLLGLLALGEIAQEGREDGTPSDLRLHSSKLHRELAAIGPHRHHLHAAAEETRLAGVVMPGETRVKAFAQRRRDQQADERLAQDVPTRVSEGRHRRRVELHDAALGVHAHDHVEARVEDRRLAPLALLQRPVAPDLLGDVADHGHPSAGLARAIAQRGEHQLPGGARLAHHAGDLAAADLTPEELVGDLRVVDQDLVDLIARRILGDPEQRARGGVRVHHAPRGVHHDHAVGHRLEDCSARHGHELEGAVALEDPGKHDARHREGEGREVEMRHRAPARHVHEVREPGSADPTQRRQRQGALLAPEAQVVLDEERRGGDQTHVRVAPVHPEPRPVADRQRGEGPSGIDADLAPDEAVQLVRKGEAERHQRRQRHEGQPPGPEPVAASGRARGRHRQRGRHAHHTEVRQLGGPDLSARSHQQDLERGAQRPDPEPRQHDRQRPARRATPPGARVDEEAEREGRGQERRQREHREPHPILFGRSRAGM